MARALVWNVDEKLLRGAIDNILSHIWSAETIEAEEIFERLVQLSATGTYVVPSISKEECDEALEVADEIIEKDIDEQVAKFREQMNDFLDLDKGEDDDA